MPKFSVIIPVVRLNEYVSESVDALLKNSFNDWELIIVTNNNEKSIWKDDRISILESGRVGPGEKRDLAANIARGEILAFLDDDAFPNFDWLQNAAQSFKTGIDALGGPSLTPLTNTFWQKVSGSMYEKKLLGGDPLRYSQINKSTDVDDWPSVNLFVKKEVFLKVGGFDCKFWPGEDTLLCLKLKNEGIKIKYDSSVFVWHHRRPNLASHIKQLTNYGLHRGYFARKFPKTSFRIKYFMPSFLLITAILFVVGNYYENSLISNLSGALLIFYLLSVLSSIISMIRNYSLKHLVVLFLYTVMSHFAYGFYFMRGFMKKGTLQSKLRA